MELTDGNNEDIGKKLIKDLKLNFKMILDYSNTLSEEERNLLVDDLMDIENELTEFANELTQSADTIGE